MSAARDLLPQVNAALWTEGHALDVPGGTICQLVRADPRYDAGATGFLDPLELGDIYVFSDGSSLHYDYSGKCWRSKRGTITSFGGVRTLRRKKGAWYPEPAS